MTDEKPPSESFEQCGSYLKIGNPDRWPVDVLLLTGFVKQVGEPDGKEVYVWTESALRLADEFWKDYIAHKGI